MTVPSSSGLGHRPLTAVTRVRVSLGSPLKKRHHGAFLMVIGRDYTIPTNVFVSLAPAALSKPSLIAWLIKNTKGDRPRKLDRSIINVVIDLFFTLS